MALVWSPTGKAGFDPFPVAVDGIERWDADSPGVAGLARTVHALKRGREMPQTGAAVSGAERTVTDERRGPRTADRPTQRVSGSAGAGVPGRRTVTIRGQAPERYRARRADGSRRPRPERRHERASFRPDRAALWAFLLGVMLILAAVTSAHAATL
jgi:hypothetical protein